MDNDIEDIATAPSQSGSLGSQVVVRKSTVVGVIPGVLSGFSGSSVGLFVGSSVGFSVGLSVGLSVGFSVGLEVPPCVVGPEVVDPPFTYIYE